MKIKKSILFALMVGAVISFTACSSDTEKPDTGDVEEPKDEEPEDELTEEEKQELKRVELQETITANFETITNNKWQYEEFEASESMIEASKTEDGADALTTILNSKHSKNFNLTISFNDEKHNVSADVNLEDEQIDIFLKEYQDELYPDFADWGFILGKDEVLGAFRRIVASPFAADNLKIDEITDEDTGLVIFSIEMRDFTDLSYEDTVLAQNKLIKDNADKMYLNEEGTLLTVETTHEKYGVSKVIYKLVE